MSADSLLIFFYGMLSICLAGCGALAIVQGYKLLITLLPQAANKRNWLRVQRGMGCFLLLSSLGWGWLAKLTLTSVTHDSELSFRTLAKQRISFQMLADANLHPAQLLENMSLAELYRLVEIGKKHSGQFNRHITELTAKIAQLQRQQIAIDQSIVQQGQVLRVIRENGLAMASQPSKSQHINAAQIEYINDLEPSAAGARHQASPQDYRPNTVLFAFNDAKLTPLFEEEIHQVAKWLQLNKNFGVTLEGHTDSDGDNGYNQLLARRRTETVKASLIERGVSADRISTKTFGEQLTTTVSRIKLLDRRVNFRVHPLN